eukprot:13539497-Alexandrium_andersonii.AAC.1
MPVAMPTMRSSVVGFRPHHVPAAQLEVSQHGLAQLAQRGGVGLPVEELVRRLAVGPLREAGDHEAR